MKVITAAYLTFLTINVSGQNNIFTDNRDGNQYGIVQVEDMVWMKEDLRFQTISSFCSVKDNSQFNCKTGNFYPLADLENACPVGWRLPTLNDWASFVIHTIPIENRSHLFEHNPKKYSTAIVDTEVGFFHRSNILGLNPKGRVEGGIWRNLNSVDYWTRNLSTADGKFHMHITDLLLVGHAHKHHIIDKEQRVRMFAIRCVRKAE